MYECINCIWKGEILSIKPLEGKCPICGDEVLGQEIIVQDSKGSKDSVNISVPNKPSLIARVKDVVDDLKDDGKRNYSNRRGRPKKVK